MKVINDIGMILSEKEMQDLFQQLWELGFRPKKYDQSEEIKVERKNTEKNKEQDFNQFKVHIA